MGIRIYSNSFSNPEYYSYSYSLKVDSTNNIRIRIRVKIIIRDNTGVRGEDSSGSGSDVTMTECWSALLGISSLPPTKCILRGTPRAEQRETSGQYSHWTI